jgi:O-antigen/teichoic acid export membrane protein
MRRQAEVLIAGMMVSPAALGFFSVPRDLSMRIAMTVNPVITRVGFPVMSRLQDDISALKYVYLQTLRMTTSVNFPIYVALALFADEIVALLYGPQWKNAVMYLRALAAWGMLRSVGNPVGSLLHAVGAVKRALLWNSVLLMVVPLLYWFSINGWGLGGLAAGLVLVQAGLILPTWHFLVRPFCGAAAGEYLRQITTPLQLALVSGLAAWLATEAFPHGVLRLAIGSAVGGLVYALLSYVFNRQWFEAMRSLLRLPVHKTPE